MNSLRKVSKFALSTSTLLANLNDMYVLNVLYLHDTHSSGYHDQSGILLAVWYLATGLHDPVISVFL